MTYLGVHLKAGEQWRFEPPQGHTVAWAAIGEGSLSAPAALHTGERGIRERAQVLRERGRL